MAEFVVVEDDDDPAVAPVPTSALERARARIAEAKRADAQRERVVIRLREMPSFEAVYRIPTDDDINQVAKKAKAFKRLEPQADNLLLLARCNVGLRETGEGLVDDDGVPLTYASAEVKAWAEGAETAADAAYFLLRGGPNGPGSDVAAHAEALLQAARYGLPADVDEEGSDPTRGR